MATMLWNKGYSVYCPHLNCDKFEAAQIKQSEIDEGNLEILTRCDYLIMLEGWNSSTSAILEVKKAQSAIVPMYEDLKEFYYEVGKLDRINP